MRSFFPLLLLVLLPPPGPPAQTALVHPPAYAAEDAPWRFGEPFSLTGPSPRFRSCRYLQVHDNLLTRPGKIVGLAFRRDGATNFNLCPSYKVTLELRLSTARTTSRSIDRRFDANHGPDLTVVIPKTTIRFPATTPKEELPYPSFDYVLSFSGKPFLLAAGKAICWEVRVYDNDLSYTIPSPSFDGPLENRRDFLVRPLGKGSFAPGRTKPMISSFDLERSTPPASIWYLSAHLENGPARGSAFLLFSSRKVPSGIPLPGGAGLLYLDPTSLLYITGPKAIDYTGTVYFRRFTQPGIPPIPAYPSLYGTCIHGQFLCLSRNSRIIYASRAAILQLPREWPRGGGPAVGTCRQLMDPTSTSGMIYHFTGLVTKFFVR